LKNVQHGAELNTGSYRAPQKHVFGIRNVSEYTVVKILSLGTVSGLKGHYGEYLVRSECFNKAHDLITLFILQEIYV
jgi:hypothetical protein